MRPALDEIAAAFGRDVRIAYGSSGNLSTQIEQGAPFELFLSADEELPLKLAASGRAQGKGVLYAAGRIVLFAPRGSPVRVDAGLPGLRQSLGNIRRFAIANPEHAPYGRAAEQALRAAGLWDAIRPRLVMGENVSQAAQFAASGSAQGGIFAWSLALEPALAKAGTHVLLPEKLHEPLRQRMILLKGAGETARAFYSHLQMPESRAVFKRRGFPLPGE